MSIKKFKILFVLTPSFDPFGGGVQRTTFKLGKYFTEKGHQVHYFSTANIGNVKSEFGELSFASNIGGANNSENISELKDLIKKINPHIVINQMPYEKLLRIGLVNMKNELDFILLGCLRNSLFSFKNNARVLGKNHLPKWTHVFVDTLLGEYFLQLQHWIKHRSYLRDIIDSHDLYILLAPPNRLELEHFVGKYKTDKIISIPNSIPEVFYETIHKDKTILHVGRIDIDQKRSDLLLDFWEKVHVQLADWNFVIVGDGPYFSKLKDDLLKRNIPRVRLEGNQDPDKYYKQAPIFMMPSAYEGFPNTILEAQSNGCVPLAFNSYSALDWIVNNKKDAFLAKPYDTSEMANQAIGLALDLDKLKEMKTNSLNNANRFVIDNVGEQWLSLFSKIVS